MASKIKKGDTVRVIAGKEKDKEGKVLHVKEDRVLIEGINMVSRHTKPNASNAQGGIVQKEAPIHISNVMLVEDGKTVRVGFRVENGKKVRFSKKSGKTID